MYLPTDIYVPAFEDIEQAEMKILRNISLCHGKMKKGHTVKNWRV